MNARIVAERCTESKHSAARRQQSIFCVDCGQIVFALFALSPAEEAARSD